MKYMGSKNRIAKHILPIMNAERKPDQWWVEPFVGGGNMIDKVQGKRLGGDANPFVIDALVSIRDSLLELPRNNSAFTESDYKQLSKKDSYSHKGYAGFAFSYGGKWLGGWCRDSKGIRDYVQESYKNAVKQSPLLQGVSLVSENYLTLFIPDNSLIYCDPPYEGTTKYGSKFDHHRFWQWCKAKGQEGHTVYVSEYNAPSNFVCVWQKEMVSSLTKDTGSKKATEKLFKYNQ